MDSLSGSVVVFTQIDEILLVDVLDGDLMVEGVHIGVLHDGLDPFFLGELDQFTAGGRIFEIFCKGGEEEIILDFLDGQGPDEDGFGGGGEERFCPGNDVGGDGAINQELLSQVTFGREPLPVNHFLSQWGRRDGCPHLAGWRCGRSGMRWRSQ